MIPNPGMTSVDVLASGEISQSLIVRHNYCFFHVWYVLSVLSVENGECGVITVSQVYFQF